MDLSKQTDSKLYCENLKQQVDEMSNELSKLKNKRNWSMALIRTGEIFLLASLVSLPVLGLVTGLMTLGLGAAFYGAGRTIDKKIVNNYNEISEEIGVKSRKILDIEFENKKEKETKQQVEKSNVKVENKTVATKTIDEGKEI